MATLTQQQPTDQKPEHQDSDKLTAPAAHSVGRPKAITPEVVHELIEALRKGADITTACILSGISTSTYYNELARNKRFMDKMTIAQQETTFWANLIVSTAVKKGDLKTSKWWLERQDRRELHAQRVTEHRSMKKLVVIEMQQDTD